MRFDITDMDPEFFEDNGLTDPMLDDPSFGGTGFGPSDAVFSGFFGLVVVLVVVGIVITVVMNLRRARTLHRAGIDPLDPDTDLQVRMAHRLGTPSRAASTTRSPVPPAAPAPARSVEERLAEVDRLRAAGTINAEEHDAARGRILGSL